MADHQPENPDTPPIHLEVKERFATASYVVATLLGAGAVALGILFGIVLAND